MTHSETSANADISKIEDAIPPGSIPTLYLPEGVKTFNHGESTNTTETKVESRTVFSEKYSSISAKIYQGLEKQITERNEKITNRNWQKLLDRVSKSVLEGKEGAVAASLVDYKKKQDAATASLQFAKENGLRMMEPQKNNASKLLLEFARVLQEDERDIARIDAYEKVRIFLEIVEQNAIRGETPVGRAKFTVLADAFRATGELLSVENDLFDEETLARYPRIKRLINDSYSLTFKLI
jgi:hypothetical protein